ncbi:MAG: hypothetical protein JXB46_06500 [Candidatus Eisenbacteria bacterium]|nr:hypothetical protein [Candidatus Eisenbacteria bacterium]
MNEQLEFLKLVVSRLDSAGIPYMLTGSMAMSVYAPPRMTRDADLVVGCETGDATRVTALFSADCYIDAASVRDAIEKRTSFNVIHNEWIVKADFIVRKDTEYRREEFRRRRKVSMGEWELWVAAPEDLLLSKLEWSRNGSSELQLRDAQLLAESVDQLDWDYVKTWASRLGLGDILEEVEPS